MAEREYKVAIERWAVAFDEYEPRVKKLSTALREAYDLLYSQLREDLFDRQAEDDEFIKTLAKLDEHLMKWGV